MDTVTPAGHKASLRTKQCDCCNQSKYLERYCPDDRISSTRSREVAWCTQCKEVSTTDYVDIEW